LLNRLDEGLHRKLTLVSAPLGFGKTTLLSEWINHQKAEDGGMKAEENKIQPTSLAKQDLSLHPFQVAWVSLDARDNDPVRFWTYVIAALDTLQPKIGAPALTLLHAPQPPPLETTLTALINSLDAMVDRFVLVLDDYHEIETEQVHETLTFLLDNLPPQMHVIIISRTDPPLPLTRLRVRDQLTELRSQDLRFTPAEAATFLNQIMKLDLSPDDITALEARTEGWVAGLQLAALSLKGRNNVQNFVQAFTGSHRYVIDYLADEVLTRQPDTTRQFLLQTSVLGRLSGPLCDVVTGRTDSQQVLELLEATNLFLIPLDNDRRWYRYHHLFADVLQEHLEKTASQHEIATLHQRAGNWYAANNLPEDAVDHTLAAGNLEQAINLIETIAISMLVHGEIVTLMRWLNLLTEESVLARPRLALAKAWAWLIMGRLDEIDPLVDQAEQILLVDQVGNRDDAIIQGMLAEVSAIRAMTASFYGVDVPKAIELSRQALQQLPEADETLIVRGVLTYNMGMGYAFLNDFDRARKMLSRAQALSEASDNLITAVLSINNLASLEMEQGRLPEAADLYRQALNLSCHDPRHQNKHQQPLPIAGRSYMDLAEIYREWNDLEKAREYLDIACKLGQAKGALYVIELSNVVFSRILQAEGDAAGALAAIEKAVELTLEGSDIATWTPAVRARLWLMQGNLTDAANWAETCGLPLDDDFHYTQYPGEYSTLVRVWLAQKQFADAWNLLQRMRRAAEESERTGRLIEVLLLQALTLSAQNNVDEALSLLTQALSLAELGGYIRLFVDEGEPVEKLLQRMKAEGGRMKEYQHKLLAAFGNQEKFHSSSLAKQGVSLQPLIDPLSDRELEVLHLIAEGLSNREIARKLVITVGTTKTHINNIYRKLEVRSRTQAIARAGELELLDKAG